MTVLVAGTNVSEDLLATLAARCDEAERRRAAAFGTSEGGARWLVARALLRTVVGDAVGIDPVDVSLAETAKGKPIVARSPAGGGSWTAGEHPPHVSLSHAGAWAVVALADRPVGIDIEADRRLRRPERLADRLFGDRGPRRDRWAYGPEPERLRSLMREWVRTEAVLKATGEGLGGGVTGALSRLGTAGWSVHDLDLGSVDRAPAALIGAVAAHGQDWVIDGPHWVEW